MVALRKKAFVCILPLLEAIAPVLGSYWRRTEGESPQKPSSALLLEPQPAPATACFVQLHLEDGFPRYKDDSVLD